MTTAPQTRVLFPWGQLVLGVSARTDRGLVRRINEDSFLAEHPIYLVADGMGGHEHGDRASQEVARVFSALAGSETLTLAMVLDTLREANSGVRSLTEGAEGDAVAGTTLAGLAFVADASSAGSYWMAFNIGDSRVYGWDGDEMLQVTVDHSAVQELVDEGIITAEEATYHPQRNVITRAVGVGDEVDADVWLLPAGGQQTFVICSDGLTKEISDAEIGALLRENAGLGVQSLADILVEAALAAGGADNVTVVVVQSTVEPSDDTIDTRKPATAPPGVEFLEETQPRI